MNPVFLQAHWPAPAKVRTLISTRAGGVSLPPYAGLNTGLHVGDDAAAVMHNREVVAQYTGKPVAYLQQTHSTIVVAASAAVEAAQVGQVLEADASVDTDGGAVCAVMTADCLPVLLCDRRSSVVAAAHAGWRGLADGIVQQTVAAMGVPGRDILAYLGPAIGPGVFEVGEDVRAAFATLPQAGQAFVPAAVPGKYRADIYALARKALAQVGVEAVYGGGRCTVSEAELFFSYRRDRCTGRMLSAVWLD